MTKRRRRGRVSLAINRPTLGRAESRAVMRVLARGILTSSRAEGGEEVSSFEAELGKFLGVKHVVAVSSGTVALYLALLASGLRDGDEVLVPSLTFAGTVSPILAVGAHPVFVDVRAEDMTIDPADARRRISQQTKIVIPVHLYGQPAEMKEISEIAEEHGITVVEDAAQSIGSTYFGRQTGSIGDIGILSFWGGKIITCGEGGAITTASESMAERLRRLRSQEVIDLNGREVAGLNFRMSELHAAVGRAQLRRLPHLLKSRRKKASLLTANLSGMLGVGLPRERDGVTHNWYVYTMIVDLERDRLLDALKGEGIDARAYYRVPLHRAPHFRRWSGSEAYPKTDWAAEHMLSLPVHPFVTERHVRLMVRTIRDQFATP